MSDVAFALLLGLTAGVLSLAANRFGLLAWIALTPLALALRLCTPLHTAAAAALAAIIGSVGTVVMTYQRGVLPIVLAANAPTWSIVYAAAALLLRGLPAAWSVVLLPLAAVTVTLPLRIAGAPRWIANFMVRSQEAWLPVVHIARLGDDLVVTALLALASACAALVLSPGPMVAPNLVAAGAGSALVAAGLVYGVYSYRAAVQRCAAAERVRVAAVVEDARAPSRAEDTAIWPHESGAVSAFEATVCRYQQHVQRAARAGAEIIVLPEVAVHVDARARARWLEATAGWATHERVVIVVPYFDVSELKNELVIFDAEGCEVGRYSKQHPGPMEPKRTMFMRPGPFTARTPRRVLALSCVICVDLDYTDLVGPVRAIGGFLAAPSNDWPRFEAVHHRTAVWAAVLSGVPVVRATGHGTSGVFDGAGRVLAMQSSFDGPVVLIADVPLAPALAAPLGS